MDRSLVASQAAGSLLLKLAPHLTAITVVFLVTGAALATVPIFVGQELRQGPEMIGLISGAQFVAAVISRLGAGRYSDHAGPKKAVIAGLAMAVVAGLIYVLSFQLRSSAELAAGILLVGRALLGGSESFIIIGAQTWALAIAGPLRAAQVIGWAGTALFTALALGAPLGSAIHSTLGFGAVGLFTTITPAVILLVVLRLPAIGSTPGRRMMFHEVLRLVFLPGICMALAGFGYGAMVSFGVLHFVDQGWMPAWAALTLFSIALIMARIVFGSLPDRLGGPKAATLSLLVQASGFGLIALTHDRLVGFAAVWIAGFGYSIVYPALGREAVRRVREESRGMAVAVYTAFIDLTLGLASPALGFLAGKYGTGSVFAFSAATALLAIPLLAGFRRS